MVYGQCQLPSPHRSTLVTDMSPSLLLDGSESSFHNLTSSLVSNKFLNT